jgi:hypothetical protein
MAQYESERLARFLDALGYDEEPMAMLYTDNEPAEGFAPSSVPLPSLEDDRERRVDWKLLNENWSCVLGKLRLARHKKTAAFFGKERFGCLGGAFFLGFNKPQLETIVHYVSAGIPNVLEGERYFPSPDAARQYYRDMDPEAAPGRFCVFKPISLLGESETPEIVTFFAGPEVISGLHQLTLFVTDDPEAVMSPWGAGCANLVAWPRRYKKEGKLKACLGGWDPSCRRFLKQDEITLTLPVIMFDKMLSLWTESFLTQEAWRSVRKRIDRGRRVRANE